MFWFHIKLYASHEWQAVPFCLLFAGQCAGTSLADRKRPHELLAELINWD